MALDLDLRKIYGVSSDGTILCKAEPDVVAVMGAIRAVNPRLLLMEVASPVDYCEQPGAAYQKRRWMIWNIATATILATWAMEQGIMTLVSPSSAWTRGFKLEQRHAIAKCQQKQKDLREAEAMIAFHRLHPAAWVDLDTYLERI